MDEQAVRLHDPNRGQDLVSRDRLLGHLILLSDVSILPVVGTENEAQKPPESVDFVGGKEIIG
jgi:hypothetical protein